MENWVRVVQFLSFLLAVFAAMSNDGETKTYIVHVAKSQMPDSFSTHENRYASVLGAEDKVAILYNYEEAFHGFATRLNAAQTKALEKMDGVLGIYPENVYKLHTTRSPEFLGLDAVTAMWPEGANLGQDVVVGVLDTGIWPESESFNDEGMGPVPLHWKGVCEAGTNFQATVCNKKIVGARFFSMGYEASVGPINEMAEFRSPRDQDGHGTHTASTAVGSEVIGASLLGLANGTARGMASKARIAVYKVCWLGGCFGTDILAAMCKAVADGVDVLSISLGGGIVPYYRDSISLGAFVAMERGVFVSSSAGNSGPDADSVSNVAPWIATVGASTMDRDFPAVVQLGNGMIYSGVSLYHGRQTLGNQVSLVYQGSNTSSGGGSQMNLCLSGTLDSKTVAGKIVVCDRGVTARVAKGAVVKEAGGAGMILANTEANGEELVADCHMLPALAVGKKAGEAIKQYIKSTPNPTATIDIKGTTLGIKPSPVVAAFSSRGPNIVNPEILKPDVIAPGVNILAAWTGFQGPTGLSNDPRRVKFNIISGTSMSCPHISGIAAIIKGAHPDWSPAAIKSALMTTAYTVDNTHNTLEDAATASASTAFDHGSGHVDPQKALNPGLVYDITVDDYVEFLCSLKYTPAQINLISKSIATCHNTLRSPGDLNYPSFSVVFSVPSNSSSDIVVKYTRTVTNVAPAGSKYVVTVAHQSTEVSMVVEPQTLYFAKTGDKQTYTVTFIGKPLPAVPDLLIATFGSLTWSNGVHTVRSPVAFRWQSGEFSGQDPQQKIQNPKGKIYYLDIQWAAYLFVAVVLTSVICYKRVGSSRLY